VGGVTVVLWWAIQLARDVDACRDLLNGVPVDPDRLQPEVLERMKTLRLVTLDVRAIDLLFSELPAARSIYDEKEAA
jgi:hypothetical protein